MAVVLVLVDLMVIMESMAEAVALAIAISVTAREEPMADYVLILAVVMSCRVPPINRTANKEILENDKKYVENRKVGDGRKDRGYLKSPPGGFEANFAARDVFGF